MLDLECLAV